MTPMTPFRLILALIFASLLSQFPSFSDQYVERLGAEAAVLADQVKDFDKGIRTASASDDTAIIDRMRAHMKQETARLETTRDDLEALSQSGPVARILDIDHMANLALLRENWLRFEPRLPVSNAGLVLAAMGFVLGWLLATLIGLPFRRRTLA